MKLTLKEVKTIREQLSQLKPASRAKSEIERPLSVKQAVVALAPRLKRMLKQGFTLAELSGALCERGVSVKSITLGRYLAECHSGESGRRSDTKEGRGGGSRSPSGPGACLSAPLSPAPIALATPASETNPALPTYGRL